MKIFIGPAELGSLLCIALALSGCATMPASGPSTKQIVKSGDQALGAGAAIKVVDVTDAVTRSIIASSRPTLFSQSFGDGQPVGALIGRGDVLDVSIWEAPPAALFGAISGDARLPSASALSPSTTARMTALPEQMVDGSGQIIIPFVGAVQAAGRTAPQIAREINARLAGKAHQPQTIVRIVRNAAATVTVVGDVVQSARVPLTARGERVLDILASAGGVRQPVGKMTVQLTRGARVDALPLETVIRDPLQNIRLQPDDVMTLLYQPYSFTALGAASRNEEVPFEATGLTLAQALGRVAGLQDARASAKGVFLFRLEKLEALDPATRATARTTPDGRVPVVYRINVSDPATFFVAQSFPIRDKDVLYVSNAPLADFQKFVNVVFSALLPAASIATTAAVAR